MLKKRKIDAAFISSIASANKNFKTINAGIVAKKRVQSVIIKPGKNKKDPHSATSNLLADILNLKGEVIIGDNALKAYLKNKNDYIDLAEVWHEKYNLPFVFARLSVNKNYGFYKKIGTKFANKKLFIPRYILNDYAKKRDIKVDNIVTYLQHLSYKIDKKAQTGLNLFLRKSRLLKK
jgi:chorismate dehydratase